MDIGDWISQFRNHTLLILVGGLEHEFYVSIQLGISSSQLTKSIIFQRGRALPPTSLMILTVP